MDKLDSSYIIIDYMTVSTKFWGIVAWAGREESEFYGLYYLPYDGQLVPVSLFYPEYYQTLCVRLYYFDGKAVTAPNPLVISYEDKVNSSGKPYKQLTDAQYFDSYKEALDYLEKQESGNHRLVGDNPFVSPVPLEALVEYKLIYSSDAGVPQQDADVISEVKIFEYIK